LNGWLVEGILERDDTPSYYLYEHTYKADGQIKQLRGILGACKLFRFEEGVVLPHENTMPGPIQDRLELTKACEANLSPIYTLFDDANGEFFALTAGVWSSIPTADWTTDTGDRYRLWPVSESGILSRLYALLEQKKLLIADGHHRYTTALHYRDYCRERTLSSDPLSDYTLTFATPLQNDGLTIYPTHRVVFGLEQFDPAAFKTQLASFFDIAEVPTIAAFHQWAGGRSSKSIGVAIPGQSNLWALTLKPEMANHAVFPADASSVLKGLDVSILQYVILQGIFGFTFEDIRAQRGIRYLKSDAAVETALIDGSIQVAFVLEATRLDEMRDVCLAGEKMPQKSTYFYPKLITGLVINPVSPLETAVVMDIPKQ
ncbi:DUF1015 domain-containing protein, partial [bacterium]|nr:DUF1015 domain-containing protein [bacterium]